MKKKKLNKLTDSRLLWAIISLLASLLIWVYVTGTQEQTITKTFPDVAVVLTGAENLQQSKGYVVTSVDTETVTVRIEGTRANIGNLGPDDLKAVIDLTKVAKTGNYQWNYTITYPDSVDTTAVTEISRSPEYIWLTVAQMSTKVVPVQGAFVGSAAEGYVAEEPTFEPTTITLSGPDSELAKVDHVWVTIGGDNLTKTKTADVEYTLMDADDKELSYTDITGDYDTIRVTEPISVKKEIPLSITPVYGAGATADNTVITIEPKTITISGDSSIVDGINKISLDTVDLSDFAAGYEETYPIAIPDGVQNVTGETEARVKIEIVGLSTRKYQVTNLSFINAPDGYTAEILTKSIEVTVRASEAVLAKIKADNLRAVADLTGSATAGDVSVPVKVYIDGISDAGAIGDYKMTVSIVSK